MEAHSTTHHLPDREGADILHTDCDVQHLSCYLLAMTSAFKLGHLHQHCDVPAGKEKSHDSHVTGKYRFDVTLCISKLSHVTN